MTKARIGAAAVAALVLGGCIASDQSFPTGAQDQNAMSAVTGRWREVSANATKQTLDVARSADGWLVVTSTTDAPNSNPTIYDVGLYRSGDRTFAAAQNRSNPGGYVLLGYTIENGNQLVLWNLSQNAVDRAVDSGTLTSRTMDEGDEILTSSPEALLAFFASRPQSDFSLNARYERI